MYFYTVGGQRQLTYLGLDDSNDVIPSSKLYLEETLTQMKNEKEDSLLLAQVDFCLTRRFGEVYYCIP